MKPHTSVLVVVAVLLRPMSASAHHAMDGETQLTFVQQFVSGLAHAAVGWDHFLLVMATGVLAYSLHSWLARARSL